MEKEFYIKMDNEDFGPYTFSQLCSLGIFDNTFISIPQDNSGWRMAKDIPELQGYTVANETITLESFESVRYYLREGTVVRGPYSLEELSILEVKNNDLIGINNINKWYYAEAVRGLLPQLEQKLRGLLSEESYHSEASANTDGGNHESDYGNDLYYVSVDGENFGPFNLDGLKGFGLFESTLVRKCNENVWRKANSLPELSGYTISENSVSQSQTVQNVPIENINSAIYDMNEDFVTIYEELEHNIRYRLTLLNETLQAAKPNNPEHYSEEMFEMVVQQYDNSFSSVCGTISNVEECCNKLISKYNEDEQNLNSLYIHKTVVAPSLNQSVNYQDILLVEDRRRRLRENYMRIKTETINEIKRLIGLFYRKNPLVFNERYEIAPIDGEIWHDLLHKSSDVQKRFYIGEYRFDFTFFGEKLQLLKREYPLFLNGNNIVFHYDQEDRQRCLDIVNTMIGRAMMCVPSGGLQLTMVDTNGMNGTSEEWKRLSRSVFRVCSRASDVLKILDETVQHIEHIIQNLLKEHATLAEYNAGKENQEPYRLLVIQDFPVGIPMEGINNLKKILKNGIRAGVTVILLINENEIKRSEDALKAFHILGLEQFNDGITQLYWPKDGNEMQDVVYDMLQTPMLRQIVNSVNKGFEVKTETVLNLTDYIPTPREWWSGTSASMVEIPFGMSTTKNISQLRITQESGQNTAIVIGIPGSGKSVFLHSVIVDAAVKYSPDELQMYLLDFSGVEFNIYANHKLPHARVIAPEAEREFGLSVLRELKEEGARRMAICRENDVTSIVQYRKKNPEAVMPRLLVIIDEFQKIFEIENDAISKEANSIIHIIIQEYRKFGINLLLATQRIPSSTVLPRDLIANRVVFKSAPNDFSALISWQGNIMPNLRTGQCIYNAESGAAYANEQAQGFFIPLQEVEKIVDELNTKARSQGFDNKNLIVFRGNDQPDFKERRLPKQYMVVQDIPDEVPVLLGQSIAISNTDVCAVLRKESSNNLLIIGSKEYKDIPQKLMLHAALSTTLSHADSATLFIIFNFMRPTDPQYNLPNENFENMPFPVKMINKMSEVKDILTDVKNEIDARKQNENRALTHIFLNFFAFQMAPVFDKGGRTGETPSDEGKLLDYILRNGPAMGVFTLLQVDGMDSLSRIGTPESFFTHRVIMQTTEKESMKLMNNSPLANKLFVMSRPSSKFRAFYYNSNSNVTIKFKPYK